MPKATGLGAVISVDDASGTARVISNDVTNFTTGTPRGVQDVTGVDKSAMERLLLLTDGTVTLNGVVNTSTNMSHDVFKTITTGSVNRTVAITYGSGGPTLTMECVFSDYSITRNADGSLTWTVSGVLADGNVPVWS
jgi:hypothetical protein